MNFWIPQIHYAATTIHIFAGVFWLIPIILLTGLYNMGYRGLLDWSVLTGTDVGIRMLWKLGAATVLFSIYYAAPLIMGGGNLQGGNADCHGGTEYYGKESNNDHAFSRFFCGGNSGIFGDYYRWVILIFIKRIVRIARCNQQLKLTN